MKSSASITSTVRDLATSERFYDRDEDVDRLDLDDFSLTVLEDKRGTPVPTIKGRTCTERTTQAIH